jgi:hypothetical protein
VETVEGRLTCPLTTSTPCPLGTCESDPLELLEFEVIETVLMTEAAEEELNKAGLTGMVVVD